MAVRKIKGSLVKQDVAEYVGEETYIFYDVTTGALRLYDGTPGGKALPSGGLINNYTATTGPTVNDDETSLYEIGSSWVDTTNDMAYFCIDATAGAANWINITSGRYLNQTGITGETTGIITVNGGNAALIDIAPGNYFFQGTLITHNGVTAYDPAFAVGEDSVFIGIDVTGTIIHKTSKWTSIETRTIIPLARLNTDSGILGPGSDVHLIRDDRYFIDEDGYRDRLWHERVVGVLYQNGGIINENTTNNLQLDQTAGVLFDAQKKEQILALQENISALTIYHTAGAITTTEQTPLVVSNTNYDDGTNLVPIPSNKWVNHTLLKTPKGAPQEGHFFFIYGRTLYNSQAEAEDQGPDYSFFGSQSVSGMIAVAQFVVVEGGINIASVIDTRPRWIGTTGAIVTGVTDHGELIGLVDDDHAQYHNDTRADTWLTAKQVTVVGDPTPAQDQLILALPDAARAKTLSVETEVYQFSSLVVNPDDYLDVGNAVDPLSGIIMPLNGTIVRATGHCSDTGGNTKGIDLYLNADVGSTATLGTFSTAGEQTFADTTLNIDVSAGDKIRLRGSSDVGAIQDTAITLYIKWRA